MKPGALAFTTVMLRATALAVAGMPHVPPVKAKVEFEPAGSDAVSRVSRTRHGTAVKKDSPTGPVPMTSMKSFGVDGQPAATSVGVIVMGNVPVCVGVPEMVLPEKWRPVGKVPVSVKL